MRLFLECQESLEFPDLLYLLCFQSCPATLAGQSGQSHPVVHQYLLRLAVRWGRSALWLQWGRFAPWLQWGRSALWLQWGLYSQLAPCSPWIL